VGRLAAVAVAVIAIGLAAVVGFRAGERLRPGPAPEVAIEVPATTGSITVHVAGAVAAPGLVEVPVGARLADAISMAGGALAEADLASVNLAEPLTDGMRVVVPGPGIEVTGPGPDDGRVRLSTATAEELATLPGIGPVLAGRIVDHRDDVGRFESVDDLLDVSGIGERLLAGIRELVTP
jgi:competence protein ComEA